MNLNNSLCRFFLGLIAGTLAIAVQGGHGPEKSSMPLKHMFHIQKTEEPCLVDGRLAEHFWKRSERLDGFRVDANPDRIPGAATGVRLV